MDDIIGIKDLLRSDADFRNRQTLTIFWAGFILYTLGFTLSIDVSPNYMVCDLLRLMGIVLFSTSVSLLLSFRFENRYLSLMFSLYMIWLFTVILRGFDLGYEEIKNLLFNPLNGVFLYLTPLVVLMPKNPSVLKILFKAISVLGILYLLQTAWDLSTILDNGDVTGRGLYEVYVKVLALPCGFILMTYNYQPNNRKMLALVVFLVVVALAAYRVRRGLLFIAGCILILSFLVFLYVNKRQLALIICSIFAGILALGLGLGAFGSSNLDIVNRIKERLEEDTRSEVELYYYADMDPKDWLIGRGMNGMVAAPMGIDSSGDSLGYRDGIETDYLNIILKGGIISLGLLLLIAIPAIIKGLMFSTNSLSKAAAFWILIWLISLYPSTVTTFSMNYILVWISIGLCYSPSFRYLSEETLKAYFKSETEIIDHETDEKYSINKN